MLLLIALWMALSSAQADLGVSRKLLNEAELLAALQAERDATLRLWSRGVSEATGQPEQVDPYDYLKRSKERKKEWVSQRPELARMVELIEPEETIRLDKAIEETRSRLRGVVQADPDALRGAVRLLHGSSNRIDDEVMDQLFGIVAYEKIEDAIARSDLDSDYVLYVLPGGVHIAKEFTQTDWDSIRWAFQRVNLHSGDMFYDLGSGYGRVLLYGASLFPEARFRGIEIVPERAEASRGFARGSLLKNIDVITKDIVEADYGDGQVYFLYNSFPKDVLEKVVERLKSIARKRKITLVCVGPSVSDFASLPWLKLVAKQGNNHVSVMESR
jgi:hypothetical protein